MPGIKNECQSKIMAKTHHYQILGIFPLYDLRLSNEEPQCNLATLTHTRFSTRGAHFYSHQ